ncbi:TolB family protein [Candidatus Zixiibacteriota bacterium]
MKRKLPPLFTLPKLLLILTLLLPLACSKKTPTSADERTVPRQGRWGIYALNLTTEAVELVYGSSRKIETVRLSRDGNRIVFSHQIDSDDDQDREICTIDVTGSNYKRITDNDFWDLYPCWSGDDSQIAFLSWRDSTLDIYVMDAADGENQRLLYDSGYHDSDLHWWGDQIVFTRNSQIWIMNDDGTNDRQVTDPPRAGEWGNANLPFGDYDPRLHPSLPLIVFERLVDDSSPHGNYDLFLINRNGTGETRLTETGYSQGLASWCHLGELIVFAVGAIGTEGKYDIYLMNSNGSWNHNITPDYFPTGFLCHTPIFSRDSSQIYFVGEWWE